jgi:hypothetical protein
MYKKVQTGVNLETYLIANLRLKEQTEIDEAVQYWTTLIQNAAWQATPAVNRKQQQNHNVPLYIREMVMEKNEHAEGGKHQEIYKTELI